MQKASYIGFALVGGITFNSWVHYSYPPVFPDRLENILQAVGRPLSYPMIAHLWQSHQFGKVVTCEFLTLKITFFLVAGLAACMPDCSGRSAFTHSLFFLFLLMLPFILCWNGTITLLVENQCSSCFSSFLVKELIAAYLGLVCGVLLHILADCLSRPGAKLFWPSDSCCRILPKFMCFENNNPLEYIWLWGSIFIVGMLMGAGYMGL